ncbi:Protein/nucleic acid deglycase HchA [Commensalibacter sp. Nvir]|uniref:glyoxalase III HchA n=1 Tax=Commensalibacter sp. Nvir TaxID=3069817 RepID=UPI002D6CA0C0|nr:Protein/nucleic acid deglycase HchA [Commensalibacter sp. Nvir]
MNTDPMKPVADCAEDNAYFPSSYSLKKYTSPQTDFKKIHHSTPYVGGKWKVLVIATQERYLMMKNGRFFSTGNHPVEMLLPMLHLDQAGFDLDIATISGDPVKFEMWAFPKEDEAVKSIFEKYKKKIKKPKKLSEVIGEGLNEQTPYIAVFIPGGHGVLNGVPFSKEVGDILRWALKNERFVISLCHGPAGLLSTTVGHSENDFPFKGYEICVFPDSLDTGANLDIGYIPGEMPWLVGERLKQCGVNIVNKDMTGRVHKDRHLLTGDSPLASNQLGKLAVETLLKAV